MTSAVVAAVAAAVAGEAGAITTGMIFAGAGLAILNPLAASVLLLGLRPITEAYNSPFVVRGHGLTPQQLWGVGAVLTMLVLLSRLEWRSARRVFVVGVLVAVPGLAGASLGPVTGAAVKAWFWVALAALVLVIARELAPQLSVYSIAWTMTIPAVVTLLLTVINGATSYTDYGSPTITQLTAGFQSPHTLAFAVVPLVAWVLLLILMTTDRGVRAVLALLAVALAVVVLLTTIRTGQVALAAVGIGFLFAVGTRHPSAVRSRIGRVSIAAVLVCIVVVSVATSSVRDRWLNVFSGGQGSGRHGLQWVGSGRGYLWHQAVLNFDESPLVRKLFGSGLTATQRMTKARIGIPFGAHNDALEILVAAGVVGLLVLVAFSGAQVVRFISHRSRLQNAGAGWYWLFAAGSSLAFLLISMLTGLVTYTDGAVSAALFLGVTVAVAQDPRLLSSSHGQPMGERLVKRALSGVATSGAIRAWRNP